MFSLIYLCISKGIAACSAGGSYCVNVWMNLCCGGGIRILDEKCQHQDTQGWRRMIKFVFKPYCAENNRCPCISLYASSAELESEFPRVSPRQWSRVSTLGWEPLSCVNFNMEPSCISELRWKIRIYLKWWKGRTSNQEYTTWQDSCSDLTEKSKAFQTLKSWENSAPLNQLYNKC